MKPPNSNNTSFFLVSLFVLLILPIATQAQTYTSQETSCYNMVQGKVPWNTAGNTTWNEANVRNLCKGTTNASATVSCFRSKISSGVTWDKATTACSPSALASAPKKNTAALLQEQRVELPAEQAPVEEPVKSTIAFKNYGGNGVNLRVYRADKPFDQFLIVESGKITAGQSVDTPLPAGFPTDQLEVEVTMEVAGNYYITIYRAKITSGGNNFCIEASGTAYIPVVKPCQTTQAVEAQRISFKNESGYTANMSLDYTARDPYDRRSSKTITTDNTLLGMSRAIHVPRDAVTDQPMTLKVNGVGIATAKAPLLTTTLLPSSVNDSTCFKAWGPVITPKASACSISAGARTIKLDNQGGYSASMEVVYNDGGEKTVRTNIIELLQSETIEIPYSAPNVPIQVKFYSTPPTKMFSTNRINSKFTGALCYRTEGTIISPVVSACDNSVGDGAGTDVRQIRFQNDSGFDAQMTVMYWVNEMIGNQSIPTPKTVSSGLINGLGGKFRLINIPKETSPNQLITVMLTGSATVKNEILVTTLPANFPDSPQPCFKVWGTLFNPSGGTCNQ